MKSFIILLIAPFVAILPDLTLKQLWYNLYPTPSEYIEKHKKCPEMLKILGSESKFFKRLSSLKCDFSQKIQLVNIEQKATLFERRKSRLNDILKFENINNSRHINIQNNNFYHEETTKSPLNKFDSNNKPLMDYLNNQSIKNFMILSKDRKIEEVQSQEINSIFFFENYN